MKSARYLGKKSIEIIDTEIPEISDNDVLVKNIYASICGTDVAVYSHGPNTGHKITIGQEFGHEMISKVVKVGKNVKDIKVGDIVYPYPLLARGDPSRAGTTGGFSEYIPIINAEYGKQLYHVDENISLLEGCLIEPFTVGCHAARRSFPRAKESAIVIGAGTIGIAAAISLKYFGCDKIMICDHSDFRLNIAKNLGFKTCNNSKENLKKVAMDYFGEAHSLKGMTANVDIFIDAAGASDILSIYKSMGKIESRMIIVAVLAGERPVDILHMTYAQQAIIGSGGYFPEDVNDILEIMKSRKWDIASLITHTYSLEELAAAIEKASQTDKALNVVIDYQL